MADNFYSKYSGVGGGGSGGVSSLNSLTGDIDLIAGTGITITPVGNDIQIAANAAAIGITSINADVTAAQTLVTGTAGTDFAISDNGTGQHTFNIPSSSATNRGLLTSTDWSTFNSKQAAGNYITALTGDATATGPGSVALTLATVNGNVGSFGSSTAIPSFTVNAKGLITAASTNAVIAPAGTLTGTTLAANVVSSSLTSVGTITSGTWNGTTIAVARGGTGSTTLTANNVILGNGTSPVNFVAPGSSGNILTSNGTTWTSATPAATGANTALSNLTATAINQSLVPASDNTINLGATSLAFANITAYSIKDPTGVFSISIDNRILFDPAGSLSVDYGGRALVDSAGNSSIDYETRVLINSSGNATLDWEGQQLLTSAGVLSVDWESRLLNASTGGTSVDWNGRRLLDSSGTESLNYNSTTSVDLKPTSGAAARILKFFNGAGTQSAGIKAPALSASYTLTLPVDDGNSGQILSTDGSGVLSWINLVVANGGTGVTSLTTYAPIVGGTTSTGAVQQATTNISTVGSVLKSSGNAAVPVWSNISTSVVSALVDGATPALDASLGTVFTLTSTQNPTIAVPSNATSGQKIVISFTASGANRTLSLNSGAGGFSFGSDITGLTATISGTTDYIGCLYNASTSKWNVISYSKGF